MCEKIKEVNNLNLHCLKCGSSNIINTKKYVTKVSELGLSVRLPVYKCIDCGEEFLLCPECTGQGFIEDEDEVFDCKCCHGMGVINK